MDICNGLRDGNGIIITFGFGGNAVGHFHRQVHTNVLFRVPVIPTANDCIENLIATVDFVDELKGAGEKRIELLKYNDLARSKYEALQIPFTRYGTPQAQTQLDEVCQLLSERTGRVKIFHN